jgi:hypothetical protein
MNMKFIAFLCSAMVTAAAVADDVLESECEPSNGITPICGFLAPEDLEVVPGGHAILVGGFSLAHKNGDVRVLHLPSHSMETIYSPDMLGLTAPAKDAVLWGDPACPGPPTGFAAHGIHLSKNTHGTYTLLVVNHTSREAVEWIEVVDDGGRFSAQWRGCVVIAPEIWVNDVAMLPDGGFVASHMMPLSESGTLLARKQNDGIVSGYVLDWHAESGWKKIEGTDGALPNGIQVSSDGATVYSNHYQANQVVAIDRVSGKRLWTAAMHGAPDNSSITPDGKLMVSTHLDPLSRIRDECLGKTAPYCGVEFVVSTIDPATGTVTELFQSKGAPFGGATVAVETGGSIYMGAMAGSRVGVIPVPK